MAARDLAVGALTGALVAGAVAVVAFGGLFGTKTDLVLRHDAGAPCALTGKQTEVQVGKNKKLTWRVRNHCPQPQTVTVGNFRAAGAPTRSNCSQPTEGTAPSPFQQDDLPRRQVEVPAGTADEPTRRDIELKVKKRDELGEVRLTYHFDICMGAGESQKIVDPRLIVEP